jgi:hypothetical protein
VFLASGGRLMFSGRCVWGWLVIGLFQVCLDVVCGIWRCRMMYIQLQAKKEAEVQMSHPSSCYPSRWVPKQFLGWVCVRTAVWTVSPAM